MNFKNIFFSLFLVYLSIAFIFISDAEAKKKKITIKIGTVVPGGTPWAKLAKNIRKDLRKKGKKALPEYKLKVKAYIGGTLGGEVSMARQLKQGKLDIYGGTMGPFVDAIPELSVVEMPYLFKSVKQADYVLDNILTEPYKKLLNKNGYVFMFWTENGFRNLASKDPVRTPADLNGKKFRSQEQSNYIETYKAFGATPVPIAVPEVLGALQTDVVTGFDQTRLYTFATSWYTSIKNYTITEHIYQPGFIIASKKLYESYPKPLQKIIDGDWNHLLKYRKDVRALNPILQANLIKAGVNVITLKPEERKQFESLVKPVYDAFYKTASKPAQKLLKKVQKEVNK